MIKLSASFTARPLVHLFAVMLLGLLGSASVAAQPFALPKYVAGEHYEVLASPIKLAADDKIEIMEVFWYGCGHCQKFEPIVRVWKKSLADDVVFMRSPAMWGKKGSANRKLMHAHARLYYTVDALGLPDEIHDDLFAAIVANRKLSSVADFAAIFAKYGVTEEELKAKFDSFTMSTSANKAANRIAKNYNTGGTPELVVNGRYRVSSKMSGTMPGMLEVASYLIDLERKRKK